MIVWRKFLMLRPGDRRLLIEAAARLLSAWAALRLLPFAFLMRTLDSAAAGDAAMPRASILQIRWAVETAARHLPLSLTCLPQALAACWMLKARGAAPRMHYGVASTGDGSFEAHAWVELTGIPVIGHRTANQFTLLTTFPQRDAATS